MSTWCWQTTHEQGRNHQRINGLPFRERPKTAWVPADKPGATTRRLDLQEPLGAVCLVEPSGSGHRVPLEEVGAALHEVVVVLVEERVHRVALERAASHQYGVLEAPGRAWYTFPCCLAPDRRASRASAKVIVWAEERK